MADGNAVEDSRADGIGEDVDDAVVIRWIGAAVAMCIWRWPPSGPDETLEHSTDRQCYCCLHHSLLT